MDTPIYLRIMPELRRSAYYVLAAGVPLALVAYWVAADIGKMGFVFLLCMTMIVPIRWALRIDNQGIARRLLFRWDVWTWADFSSGRIEKRHPHTLVDPERPWWRRKLSLEYMAEKKLAKIRKNDREFRQCMWVFLPLAVGCFIWMGVERSVVGAVIVAGLFFMNTAPLMYYARRQSQSRCRELEQQLATFGESDSTT